MRTLIELFETSVTKFPNNPLLWEKRKDRFEPMSYAETRAHVYEFASGLFSLGLKKGSVLGYYQKDKISGW